MNVVVVSDTHLRAGWGSVDGELLTAMEEADVVLHAGDVVSRRALAELEDRARTAHAVRGNNDHELRDVLPDVRVLELDGVRVVLVHETGPRRAREKRVRQRFPTADVVVFGHSHIPLNEVGLDGQRLFNPGSPTQRRSQPHRTFGRMVLSRGRIESASIEVLG